jgi:hypothetical protein
MARWRFAPMIVSVGVRTIGYTPWNLPWRATRESNAISAIVLFALGAASHRAR